MPVQTVLQMMEQAGTVYEWQIDRTDRETLRELAARIAENAARPVEAEKRRRWYRHNDLQTTEPMIFCDPENGWNEIIRQEDLMCKGPVARDWEMRLRKILFWAEQMGDDTVTPHEFTLGYLFQNTGWGLRHTQIGSNDDGHSFRWEAPIKDYAVDMPKLKYPEILVNFEETEKMVALANEVFGDLLPTRIQSNWFWSLCGTRHVAELRGLEQMMTDMYDYPDELHQLMEFICNASLKMLEYLEQNGLLMLNNANQYVGSGGYGFTHDLPSPGYNGHVRSQDMWGLTESQETSLISPSMFGEFVFPYQKRVAERFGLNYHGCCEPLNGRWKFVEQLPRLRRVSVSAWADLSDMSEKLGKRYVLAYKPNPADLARPQVDQVYLREKIRRDLQTVKHNCAEFVMKDNHTIGGNPENVKTWCRIVREEIAKL